MPVISRQTIDEVRRRANLVEIASRYTALKRAGREYRGLSPFTEEKTPSFFVNPEKNVFSCFSTQEAGDVFGFVQRLENLNFQEAVEQLAERVGVTIEYEKGGPSRQEMSLRKQLFEVNAQAAAYFAECFQKTDAEGDAIRAYWTEERKFKPETAKDLGIGVAPVNPKALVDFLGKKGFSDKVLDSSGLFYDRRGGGRFFPRFRGRLMIPIRDVQDRVIAFTARVTPLLPEDDKTRDAKYVNSPETPLFQKRRVVFGLHHAGAVVRGGGRFLLVEGQLDVIRCWEAGINEAIALQGTAAGEEQFLLLKRFSGGVDVLLDGDRAGRGAAFKLLSIGFRAGVDLRFAPLPEGVDPDDLLVEKGAEELQKIRAAAESPIRFGLNYLAPSPGTLDVASRAGVFEELFALLRQMESDVTRKDFIDEMARYFRTDTQAVSNDYNRFLRKGAAPLTERRPEMAAPASDLRLTGNEEVLLFLALQFPKIREIFMQTSICEWITEDTSEARLLRRLGSELVEGSFTSVDEFRDQCELEEERAILARILVREVDLEEPERTAERTFQELVRKFATKEIAHLVDNMNALPPGDPELQTLQVRRRELRNLIQKPPVLATIS